MLLDDLYASDGVMTSVVERCVFDASGVPSSVAPANGSGSISVRSDIVVLGGHLCMTNCLVARLRGNSYADGAIAIRCGQVGRGSGAAYSYNSSSSSKHTAARSSAEIVNCSIADCARPGVFRQESDRTIHGGLLVYSVRCV